MWNRNAKCAVYLVCAISLSSVCVCVCVSAHIKLTVLFFVLFIFISLSSLWWLCYRLSVCDTQWQRDGYGSNRATVSIHHLFHWNAWIYYYLLMPWIECNGMSGSSRFKYLISQVMSTTFVILFPSFLTLALTSFITLLFAVDYASAQGGLTVYCLPWHLMMNDVTRY